MLYYNTYETMQRSFEPFYTELNQFNPRFATGNCYLLWCYIKKTLEPYGKSVNWLVKKLNSVNANPIDVNTDPLQYKEQFESTCNQIEQWISLPQFRPKPGKYLSEQLKANTGFFKLRVDFILNF